MASSLILDREVARFDAQLVSRFLHDEDGRARQRARGGAGLSGLVDDPDADAQACQPQGQGEPSRTGIATP